LYRSVLESARDGKEHTGRAGGEIHRKSEELITRESDTARVGDRVPVEGSQVARDGVLSLVRGKRRNEGDHPGATPEQSGLDEQIAARGQLDGVHRASLRELVTEMSIQSLTEADLDRLVHAWHHLPAWPDSVEGMSRLRPGYVLTTLSNGGMAHLVELNRAAHLPFDCVLSVELVRTYKPDPRVYRLVPELLAVRPEESMMVASHAYDLAAAAEQGMRTAFVRRVQEWGTGKAEPLDISVDIVADDFLDLASRLGG